MRRFLCFVVLLVLTHQPTSASWPTTLTENILIPDSLYGRASVAIPYPNGSTLVVFYQGNQGNCYQILNRYGEQVFPQAPLVASPPPDYMETPAKLIPDDCGGAFVAWGIGAGACAGYHRSECPLYLARSGLDKVRAV